MTQTSQKPRTLVLCFDGTTNQFSNTNSNIVKFVSLLKRDAPQEQLCYYQTGVGTYFSPGVVSPLFTWSAKILDDAVAWYLDAHVQDGYKYLMKNYRTGDKICLFGFSRGAYTARALAGMLFKVGLLPKDNDEQVNFAYKLYTRTDKEGETLSAGFKKTFSQHVTIEFIGVWDTVASVGIVSGTSLPFVNSNSCIKTFRHALSLDEHRARFRPNLYHHPTPGPKPDHTPTIPADKQKILNGHNLIRKPSEKGKASNVMNGGTADLEEQFATDVLEVWFAGCHCDVGGSADTNGTENSLSQITLRWMVREVIASRCGIQFNDDELVHDVISSMSLSETEVNPDPVEVESAIDMAQPIHDELKIHPIWWILEILPLHYSWQNAQGIWRTTFKSHFGAGRFIPDKHPNFHVTVRDRIAHPRLHYKPNARWTPGSEAYVA